jgi:hypothetical protein
MSINTLANAATARRADFAPAGAVPKNYMEIAKAAAVSLPLATPVAIPSHVRKATPGVPSANPKPPPTADAAASNVNTALHLLFGYIPTEVLTLYVAVLAALHGVNATATNAPGCVFWIFLLATPLVVWLVYAAKVKAAQHTVPVRPSQWPVWEMLAATVAYFAWAFAMPNNPFAAYTWYSSGLAGIAVLVASTVLGLLAPLFQRPINQ